jgi:hypothetical protein
MTTSLLTHSLVSSIWLQILWNMLHNCINYSSLSLTDAHISHFTTAHILSQNGLARADLTMVCRHLCQIFQDTGTSRRALALQISDRSVPGGTMWKNTTGWGAGSMPCTNGAASSWYGVMCQASQIHSM